MPQSILSASDSENHKLGGRDSIRANVDSPRRAEVFFVCSVSIRIWTPNDDGNQGFATAEGIAPYFK